MTARNRSGPGWYYVSGIATAVLAAGGAYFFDPRSGARRRALVRDQLNHAAHQMRDFLGKAGRDARQRARGFYESSVSRLHHGVTDDRVLEERVRAELGRLSSHPGPIQVICRSATVHLRGDILEDELDRVLHGIGRVRGVQAVVNELHAHLDAGDIPALQGAGDTRPVPRFEYLQANWSPAPRLLAGTAGVAMIVTGLGRRSMPGAGLAAAGAVLLGRSICNMPLSQLPAVHTLIEGGRLRRNEQAAIRH